MATQENSLQERVQELEREVALLKQTAIRKGVRKQSETMILGMPLYHIATGPDPVAGEIRGHARGFIAIGDTATGVLAIGGVAKGFIAIGGAAMGAIAIGGCALGLLFGLGGFATGLFALGGGAVGGVAVGGGAVGYYACGGGAFGSHVISATTQDPQAIQFFDSWLPGLIDAMQAQRRG